MCGVLFTNDARIEKDAFLSALELINHRGPDATGYVQFENNQLGHNRLKILDLDNRSNQPFYSHNGRYIIIFNGEIYNYRELARKNNIEQRTSSDTEVVVELYALYGANCLSLLNGMFAIIIFDTVTNELFVARDRLGVKPLYIHQSGEVFTLASEIAPLLKLLDISKFDEVGLRQYLKLRTFFNGHTAYKDVKMFPPGHFLMDGKIHCYWKLPDEPSPPPTDDELKQLIIDSVQNRLVSDVPVGSYLSGGLDSTIVAALSEKPHTWTVGFEDNNEFEWGRIAAQHICSTHHEVLITPEEFIETCRQMIHKRREPLSVPNEVLLYKMTCEVKKENTVILSGEGADELFFGYDRIFQWAAKSPDLDLKQFSLLYSYGSHDDLEIVEDMLSPFMYRKNTLDIVAHFFQVAHLHGLLRRLDNSTMLCSVEARVPFVDHHPLIERMSGVSFEYRIKDGVIKDPLKRLFKDIIPIKVIQREKVGFPVPLHKIPFNMETVATPMDQWLNFNLKELCGTQVTLNDINIPRK